MPTQNANTNTNTNTNTINTGAGDVDRTKDNAINTRNDDSSIGVESKRTVVDSDGSNGRSNGRSTHDTVEDKRLGGSIVTPGPDLFLTTERNAPKGKAFDALHQ